LKKANQTQKEIPKKMEAIIFCGIQASGKSTFYTQNFFNTHLRISLDLLRTRNREKEFILSCIKTKMPFVIDNTNPDKESRKRYFEFLQGSGYTAIAYYFQPNIEECLKRNSTRTGRFFVPETAIWSTMRKIEAPEISEGFQNILTVIPKSNFGFSVI
jgi:predicted kinase